MTTFQNPLSGTNTFPDTRPGFNAFNIGPFEVHARSLLDLGTWDYLFEGLGYTSAGQLCPVQTDVFPQTIFNSPPTAAPTSAGSLTVGSTVALAANSADPDGGSLTHTWSITSRPPNSTASLGGSSTPSASIQMTTKHDIGTWSVRLDVTDDEAEGKTFTHTFNVPNQPPVFSITGETRIDALQHINLKAGPSTDADGESVSWRWDLLESPPGATESPVSNFSADSTVDIATGPHDVGLWHFRCTATDEHNASVTRDVSVEVRAIPPRITIPDQDLVLRSGDLIHFETTTLDDAYGKPLRFNWALIQAPVTASAGLSSGYSTTAEVTRATNASDVGTWKWRLTVTDQIDRTATEVVTALVDGLPEARILGPQQTGNLTLPLELDGGSSSDPDSPSDAPDHGHVHAEAVDISRGIVSYRWTVLDVPTDVYGSYFPGAVEDVFHVSGAGPTLSLPGGRIAPGEWLFELRVTDGEKNEAVVTHRVEVLDEGLPPLAAVSAPSIHATNAAGVVSAAISVDGSQSFDPDNLLSSPLAPGLGISDYAWKLSAMPSDCPAPSLASGPSSTQATLYAAGSVVAPACHGIYTPTLVVTDDDTPAPKRGSASTTVMIGDCAAAICIDAPTASNPEFVKLSDRTDVVVFYHLSSLLYDLVGFRSGLRVRMSIYSESDAHIPIYDKTWDLNMLPTTAASFLAVHWSGYDNLGRRPSPGRYSVALNLVDATGAPASYGATEVNAIWIQRLDVSVTAASDKYVSADALRLGTDALTVHYRVSGADAGEAGYDELRYRVFDKASATQVAEGSVPPPFQPSAGYVPSLGYLPSLGTFEWDGRSTARAPPPGDYQIEVEIRERGASLGTSPRREFRVYGRTELAAWSDEMSLRATAWIQLLVQRKRPADLAYIHHIEDACGLLNLDYYPVTISQLPVVDGVRLTPSAFLEYIRTHLNHFVDPTSANFVPFDATEAVTWMSPAPQGSIVHIDLAPGSGNPDDGSVVTVESTPDHWTFSTIFILEDAAHPVSGQRMFGYVPNADGTYTFYTRGADRPTSPLDELLQDILVFKKANELWLSLQRGIADFAQNHGGSATIEEHVSARHQWAQTAAEFWKPVEPWLGLPHPCV